MSDCLGEPVGGGVYNDLNDLKLRWPAASDEVWEGVAVEVYDPVSFHVLRVVKRSVGEAAAIAEAGPDA